MPQEPNTDLKQKLLSYNMKTGAIKSSSARPNPTLNRLQNFLLHQRDQKRKELEIRMRA